MRNIRTQLIEIVVMFFVPVASLAMLRSIELEDAKLFPNYICYIMLVFAVIHAFQVFKSWRKDKAEKGEPAPFPMRRVAVALGLMIIYFLSMEAVGFYLDGFLFFLVTTLVLSPAGSPRRWWAARPSARYASWPCSTSSSTPCSG